MPRLFVSLLLSLGIASSASAVTMDWAPISNPGNACDAQSQGCFGAVGYSYSIGTYEVTNAQYAEFLNGKATSDLIGLYNFNMSEGVGGITRSGVPGSFTYSAIAGRGNLPVNYVSFHDALRFANWMNNGQGSGSTETGAYTITPQGISTNSIQRNPGAMIVLPSEDEWYKAAYHSAITASYFLSPSGSNALTACSAPTATLNSANCGGAVGDLTIAGSYTGSASPYGTFDQGGNVAEWNEAILGGINRVNRGGSYFQNPFGLSAAFQDTSGPLGESGVLGFRLAIIPEPGTGLLVIAGLLGFAGSRRVRRATSG